MYYIYMPVVMRVGRIRFVIYPKDHRPAHVHVFAAGAEAKIEILTGTVVRSRGFTLAALKQIQAAVVSNSGLILEAWRDNEGEE